MVLKELAHGLKTVGFFLKPIEVYKFICYNNNKEHKSQENDINLVYSEKMKIYRTDD